MTDQAALATQPFQTAPSNTWTIIRRVKANSERLQAWTCRREGSTIHQSDQTDAPAKRSWGCLPWMLGAIVFVVVLAVIGGQTGDSADNEGNTDGEPGLWDIATTELSMSWYCDEVDGWEHIALWVLGHPDGLVDDPEDDREVATMVALMPYLCEYWKTNGNREIAALNAEDPDALKRLDDHFKEIGKDTLRAEIERVEAKLPELRENWELMGRLDKAIGR